MIEQKEKKKKVKKSSSLLFGQIKEEAFLYESVESYENWQRLFLIELHTITQEVLEDARNKKKREAFLKCYDSFQEMKEYLKDFPPLSYYFNHIQDYDDFWQKMDEGLCIYGEERLPIFKRTINPFIAQLIFTGMYLCKEKYKTYNKFREFYNSDEVQYLGYHRDVWSNGNIPLYLPTIPKLPEKFVDKHKTKSTLKKIIFENNLVNLKLLTKEESKKYLNLSWKELEKRIEGSGFEGLLKTLKEW